MPSGVAAADRKLLYGAGAILLLLIAATLFLSPGNRALQSPIPSSYSSDPGGALAAYLLLKDLGHDVRRWEQPPTELTAQDGTFILAEPSTAPTRQEREALRDFARRGGRVLLCGAALPDFFPEAALAPSPSWSVWQSFDALLPSYLTRGAAKVEMRPWMLWSEKSRTPYLALYGSNHEVAAVAWPIGKGEIVWWASAAPLTNFGLRRASNLPFFANSAAHGPVLWDEYYHGQRASLWSYAAGTPVIWACVQAALLAFAAWFTFGRRSGPVVALAPVPRFSPLEFVNTLGGLYHRARATPVAVAESRRRLRTALSRQLGLPPATPDDALAREAAARLGWKGQDLWRSLDAAAREDAPSPARALALVQELESFTARLKVRRSPQEIR